jgi:hypothetical protein
MAPLKSALVSSIGVDRTGAEDDRKPIGRTNYLSFYPKSCNKVKEIAVVSLQNSSKLNSINFGSTSFAFTQQVDVAM